MNNKKYIGILIIIIGLVALVGVVYFVFFSDFSSKNPIRENKTPIGEKSEQPLKQPVKTSPQRTIINAEKRVQADGKVTEEDLKRIAEGFAERFGTYSNQSNYENIRDLKIFMSSKMKKWADNYIKEEAAKNKDYSIYFGITTKAVAAKVKQFDDDAGKAEILVSARRRMATGVMSNMASYQQDIAIYFIKERGAWKVDGADWQEM